VVVDGQGTPLAARVTAANVNDGTMLATMVDAVPLIKRPHGRPHGRPRRRPTKLHADKAYASRHNRRLLQRRHIKPRIARPGIESRTRLGRFRWVVERTQAWLAGFRRLDVRYERRPELYQAFLDLACSLICWRVLQRQFR
jgi:transposase